MSFFVNAPQEDAFRLVMDYFTGRRMRVQTSNSPSYIRAEFGSWISMSLGNAKGEVEVNVMKRNSGSNVNLNFSFLKEYVGDLIGAMFGALIGYAVLWWVVERMVMDLPTWTRGEAWSMVSSFLILLVILVFAVFFAISGYNVSLTRRRFMEEFNMFIQSLASKKD